MDAYEKTIRDFNNKEGKPKSIIASISGTATIVDVRVQEIQEIEEALYYLQENDPCMDAIVIFLDNKKIDTILKNGYSGRFILYSDKVKGKSIYKKNLSALYKKIYKRNTFTKT